MVLIGKEIFSIVNKGLYIYEVSVVNIVIDISPSVV